MSQPATTDIHAKRSASDGSAIGRSGMLPGDRSRTLTQVAAAAVSTPATRSPLPAPMSTTQSATNAHARIAVTSLQRPAMDERVLTGAGPCRTSRDESSGRHPAWRPRVDEGPPREPSERVEQVLLLPHRRTVAALLA